MARKGRVKRKNRQTDFNFSVENEEINELYNFLSLTLQALWILIVLSICTVKDILLSCFQFILKVSIYLIALVIFFGITVVVRIRRCLGFDNDEFGENQDDWNWNEQPPPILIPDCKMSSLNQEKGNGSVIVKKEETLNNNEVPKLLTVWNPRFPFSKLSNSIRVQMILQHRAEIAGFAKVLSESGITVSRGRMEQSRIQFINMDIVNPAGKARIPSSISALNSIKLEDMDPFGYHSVGNKLELDIIEDAISCTRIMLLGQDKIGDVMWVALYCDSPSNEDDHLQEKVGFGCKITIANPWMKIALDGRTMIRVEDDSALFIHKLKDPKMCRFRGKANSEQKCGRCKKAFYCSRECQTHDWKILKHKEICNAYVWLRDQMQA